MQKIFFMLILVILVAGCKNDKWEYKIVGVSSEGSERVGAEAGKPSTIVIDEAEFAKLGSEGWELVTSYLEMETAYFNFGNSQYVTGIQPNVRPQRLVLIFKRKK